MPSSSTAHQMRISVQGEKDFIPLGMRKSSNSKFAESFNNNIMRDSTNSARIAKNYAVSHNLGADMATSIIR